MDSKDTLSSISEFEISINDLAQNMDRDIIFFSETHQKLRNDLWEEAAFFNNIDYFYGLLYERCDVYSDFILQKIQLYKLDYNKIKVSRERIHDLRTYKSHTLDKEKSHDKKIISNVENWFYNIIEKKNPNVGDFEKCAEELNNMMYFILTNIKKCFTYINLDDRKVKLIEEMKYVKAEYCPDYYLASIFEEVINLLQIKIDVYTVVKKYGYQIRDKIKIYHSINKEKNEETMKLMIEELLLTEKLAICPLSGNRIMQVFNLDSGPVLGKLKRRAIDIFNDNMYLTEDEILNLLQKEL